MTKRDRQSKHQKVRRAETREIRRERQQNRSRRRRVLLGVVAGFFALAIIVSFGISGLPFLQPGQGAPQPNEGVWQRLSDQGREHIQLGERHPEYNSVPPTSGWHYQTPSAWGVRTTQVIDEIQVHNLEHGGIMIQYDTMDEGVIRNLEELAERQTVYPCYIVVAPYGGLSEQAGTLNGEPVVVALTAWGVLQYLASFDETAIQLFIDTFRNRGPENVTCTPGDPDAPMR